MRYLLDTNVISEAARPRPDPGVVSWLEARAPTDLSISVLTLGEIAKGAALLPESGRRKRLEEWVGAELPMAFQGRVLGIDGAVAIGWGRMAAAARVDGRALPVIDGLLLATAGAHDLVFVTRNVADCADRGVPILNPWSDATS